MESTISWLARRLPNGEWHPGYTLNPWSGCYKKSPGCKFCYAAALPPKMRRGAEWGRGTPRVLAPDAYLDNARTWNRHAQKLGIRLPVFCASTADVFELHVGDTENAKLDGQRAKIWALVAETPWLDWLFLTKEPENILAMIPPEWAANGCPSNVWMGCTVESDAARWRVDYLREVPAVVRFLSVEPMIGPVNPDLRGIHWVLCGGESGRAEGVRPMHPDWARSLRDQCVAAGVAFHFKQHGAYVEVNPDARDPETGDHVTIPEEEAEARWTEGLSAGVALDGHVARSLDDMRPEVRYRHVHRVGKHAAGRVLDGRTWDELPEVAS
jgi:protein gp37